MISTKDYCYHSLLSLHRPGGEALLLSQLSEEPNRPLIYVEDLITGTYSSTSYTGRVIGITGVGNTNPVESDCFSPECYQSMGVWSSYLSPSINPVPKPLAEEGCVSEECFGLFNPVCKLRLPFDYIGSHYTDQLGKYRLIDVDEAYCNTPSPTYTKPVINTAPYTVDLYIEGDRLFNRYTYNGLSIAIERATGFSPGCTESECLAPKFYVYLLSSCSECFDPCSTSSLQYLGTYSEELNPIDTIELSNNNLYNDINIIDDDYLSDDGIPTTNTYRFTLIALQSLGLDLLELDYLVNQLLALNKELLEACQAPTQALEPCTPPRNDVLSNCKALCIEGYVRLNNNLVRIRTINGAISTWVEGLVDENSSVYVADIGYLHANTHEPVYLDISVPINQLGIFKSRVTLPRNTNKIISIRKIDSTASTQLLNHITGYEQLTRTSTDTLLLYNAKDQLVDLEQLSLTIIATLLSGYTTSTPCTKYYNNTYLDPDLMTLVKSNITRVIGLIDPEPSSKRYGSIPLSLATYSTASSIYEDFHYLNPTLEPFEEGLFSEECFQAWTNDTLTSRYVSNRALAWFLYAISIYIEITQDTSLLSSSELIATYLIKQMDPFSRLLREGYTHTTTYSNSSPIENYVSSTSVTLLISLLRLHDLTNDSTHIDAAADVYSGLLTHLYSSEAQLLLQSYDDTSTTLESLLYGTLLGLVVNKVELVESSLSLLTTRTKSTYNTSNPTLLADSSGEPIRSLMGGRLYTQGSPSLSSVVSTEPLTLLPFHSAPSEQFTLPEALLYQVLTNSLSTYLSASNYIVGFKPILTKYSDLTLSTQVANRYINSSTYLAACLTDQLLDHPSFITNSYYDLELLLFQRSNIYSKLKDLLPVDFTWFSNNAKSPSGNLGKLLLSFSRILSNWYVGYRRLSDGARISTTYDTYLSRWGSELLIPRRIGETQSHYRQRLMNRVNQLGITKDNLLNYLESQGIEASIDSTPIAGYNSYLEQGLSTRVGEHYLQGSLVNPSTLTLSALYPLSNELVSNLESLKPLGSKVLYKEVIQLDACLSLEGSSVINLSSELAAYSLSFICCNTNYNPSKAFLFNISVAQPSDQVLYVRAYLEQGEFSVELSTTLPSEGMIGLLRPGELTKMLRVPAFFPLKSN